MTFSTKRSFDTATKRLFTVEKNKIKTKTDLKRHKVINYGGEVR
jgi:hypothetical protein